MDIPRVAVFPPEELVTQRRLLSGIEELYDVTFVAGRSEDPGRSEAAVLFRASREQALRCARAGLRCLAFMDEGPRVLQSASPEISLADTPYLPLSVRGSMLSDPTVRVASRLGREPGEEVVAQRGAEILWLHCKEATASLDLVAAQPPHVPAGDYLFSSFQENHWFSLLPLLHFAQEVSGWTAPSCRACFMFDDPNMHWKSYGYVRYGELATDASLHNYHVSFATVPVDGWYVHQPTARLFRENRDRLSLLVHGNNHTTLELLRTPDDESRRALAAQALRRVDRLEQVANVPVSRVMAAPHGACSGEMAKALLQTGFEAASISRGSLMSRNSEATWPVGVGLHPATFFGGLPVLPRFGMREATQTQLRLAMFLGQPLIPMGHHDDLRDGLHELRRIADRINSLGDVHWTDMESIARSSYLSRQAGNHLQVKMYSKRIRLRVPDGVDRIVVRRPWLEKSGVEELVVREGDRERRIDGASGEALALKPSAPELTIISCSPEAIDRHAVPARRTPLRAILRRQLCEVRDRLRPNLDPWLAVWARQPGPPVQPAGAVQLVEPTTHGCEP